MDIESDNRKRKDLRVILAQLASSETVLQDTKYYKQLVDKLREIYQNNNGNAFRHFYSDIFAELTMIDGEEEDYKKCSIDILAENLQQIWDKICESNEYEPFKLSIKKLYDHVNLDIARINYVKVIDRRSEESKSELNSKAKSLKTDIEAAQKKVDGMQREYITILGIFSAIVLSFIGGLVFSTSVLENMNDVSIYRILIITVFIAFVFLNLISLLIDFIMRINSIRDEPVNKFKEKQKWYKKRMPNIFIINIILGIIGLFIFIGWLLDVGVIAEMLRNKLYQ
jgi:hypothetical protein